MPKFDGDLGRPNVFVPLRRPSPTRRSRLLHEHFPTQAGKHWFDADTFRGLMRLRGMEAYAPTGFAEAFTCRKLPLSA